MSNTLEARVLELAIELQHDDIPDEVQIIRYALTTEHALGVAEGYEKGLAEAIEEIVGFRGINPRAAFVLANAERVIRARLSAAKGETP